MKRKKWSLSDVEATIAIVVITVTAAVNFITLRSDVKDITCQFLQSEIINKKRLKLDYSSSRRANVMTKEEDQDAFDYWKVIEEKIITLSTEIKSLEEKRAKGC